MVEAYDPTTNTWSVKANMLSSRDRTSVAVINGKIYLGGSNYDNSVEMYDPLTNSWMVKSPMITARYKPGLVPYDGKLYALGGYNRTPLKSIEEYDPKTDSWSVSTCVLSTPRYGGSTVVFDDKIYYFGGMDNNYEYCNTVESITITNDEYGDDFSNAKEISTGVEIRGDINYPGDVDYFKFVAPETTKYVTYGSGRWDILYGEIYDASHALLAVTQDYGNQYFLTTVSLQAGHTYYLMVQDYYDVDYDEYAFIITQQQSEKKQMEYVYDSRGNLITIKNNASIRAYLEYDRNGNLISIRQVY